MMNRLFLAASAVMMVSGGSFARTLDPAPAPAAQLDAAFATVPPAPVVRGDPADSLYRLARNSLNNADYVKAAELFDRILNEYPQSTYAADALYWEAFAYYKTDDTEQLRRARTLLEQQASRFPKAGTRGDAATLRTRIDGLLAQRGDADAAESVTNTASQPCAKGDDDMRAAALSALQQMDKSVALPILKQVLTRRDNCSASLRKKAVFIVSQIEGDESTALLSQVLRSDPDLDVRKEAIWWIAQQQGDKGVALLDSIVQAPGDDALRRRALEALSQTGPRGRESLERIVTNTSNSDDLRKHAIDALGHMDGSPEAIAFLRQAYPKLGSEALREHAIGAIAQEGDSASATWLLRIAEDTTHSIGERKQALFWAGQSGVPVTTLSAMYDRTTDSEMKEQLIFVLSQRDDKPAVDKLLDIARKDTDREMRKKAIFWLGQKDDPRVRDLLLEIISQ